MATKIRVTKPPTGELEVTSNPITKTPVNDNLDARDILSYFAGNGKVGLPDEDARSNYKRLTMIVGAPKAQQLLNQVSLFHQRPEVQKMTPEQKVNGFFALGSNNPDINSYMKGAAGLGYGVLDGFRNSPLVGNMTLNGYVPPTTPPPDVANAEKIKLLVKKNIK
jgi:hypothetical protein